MVWSVKSDGVVEEKKAPIKLKLCGHRHKDIWTRMECERRTRFKLRKAGLLK